MYVRLTGVLVTRVKGLIMLGVGRWRWRGGGLRASYWGIGNTGRRCRPHSECELGVCDLALPDTH